MCDCCPQLSWHSFSLDYSLVIIIFQLMHILGAYFYRQHYTKLNCTRALVIVLLIYLYHLTNCKEWMNQTILGLQNKLHHMFYIIQWQLLSYPIGDLWNNCSKWHYLYCVIQWFFVPGISMISNTAGNLTGSTHAKCLFPLCQVDCWKHTKPRLCSVSFVIISWNMKYRRQRISLSLAI